MFRYDRPQAGRYRQFWQFDIEAIGDAGPGHRRRDRRARRAVLPRGRARRRRGPPQLDRRPGLPARRTSTELTGLLPRPTATTCRSSSAAGSSATSLRLLDSKDPAMAALNAAAPRITDRLCDACAEHFAGRPGAPRRARRPRIGSSRGSSAASTTTRGPRSSSTSRGREGQQQAIGGGGRYDGLVELLGGRPTPGHRLRHRARSAGPGAGRDRASPATARAGAGRGRRRRRPGRHRRAAAGRHGPAGGRASRPGRTSAAQARQAARGGRPRRRPLRGHPRRRAVRRRRRAARPAGRDAEAGPARRPRPRDRARPRAPPPRGGAGLT